MGRLTIEWRHYAKAGTTCVRCAATGRTLAEIIAELEGELAGQGVVIDYLETVLPQQELGQSNMILFNGIPLELLLSGAAAAASECRSCSCLTGSTVSCRTVVFAGQVYEEIPGDLIRQAAYAALERRPGQ